MSLINNAYDFLSNGFNPLPLKDNKAPMLQKGHDYLYNRIEEKDIEKIFAKAQKIGIACGKVSDGFYCMDFDAHNQEPISEIYKSFISFNYIHSLIIDGKLSIYSTAGGGYHLYFIYDEEVISGNVLSYWETKSVMIELRGNGQYVCCYPSQGYIHIAGVELEKLNRLEGQDEYLMITDLAHSFNRYKEILPQKKNESGKKWAENWKETTPDGKYNLEFEHEAKELLAKIGWQYCESKNNIDYWTRPNKDVKDGFSATFGHFKGMFYVFSEDGNCSPFKSKQAYSPFNILTEIQYNGDWKRAKNDLITRFNMVDNEVFWSTNEKGVYSLNNKKFKDFLEANDFFKNSPNESSSFNFIKKEGIFLNIAYEKDIKDYVIDWIDDNKKDEGVFNLMTGNLKFFKREYLSFLKTNEIKTLKDTKDECFLFYKNCIVRIDKDKRNVCSYEELNQSIWKTQVISRDYIVSDHHNSEYRTFIWKVAGENVEKYNAFKSVIGYLLHSFKTNSNNKCIIFNDETISENPNGRSGKGLFWNALKKIRNTQRLDGKMFDFGKSFPYQSVSTDCQILVFDDVVKNFKFENLFSVITEGISIEYKGKDIINLDVSESPKIIITTNYTIKGDSASFLARKYDVEMSNFFNDKYTPIDLFGHELFNDWDDDEWHRFDNYMIGCISFYLKNGLLEMPLKNLDFRKLIDTISNEMHNFFEGLKRNEWLKIKELYDKLLIDFPELKKRNITQNKMTANIKSYCAFYKLQMISKYNGGVGKVFILDESKTATENLPF